MDRKEFFKTGLKKLFQTADKIQELKEKIPELLKSSITKELQLEQSSETPQQKRVTFKNLSLPPGAAKPRRKFISKCTSCGDCISACPHNAIFPIYIDTYNKSVPFVDVNLYPCHMCLNYPCIQACRYDALQPLENEKPKFGKAKLIFENCLNSDKNYECDVCEKVCPVEKAVRITKRKPMFSKNCTGCGICVQNCPVYPKAIVIQCK